MSNFKSMRIEATVIAPYLKTNPIAEKISKLLNIEFSRYWFHQKIITFLRLLSVSIGKFRLSGNFKTTKFKDSKLSFIAHL